MDWEPEDVLVGPLIEEIAGTLRRGNEAEKCKTVLNNKKITSLRSACGITSQDWSEWGLPLRILTELRKLEKKYETEEKKGEQVQQAPLSSSLPPRLLKEVPVIEQSFKDLSQFIKPSEDKKRPSSGNTLRRILFRASMVHAKHRSIINTIGREGHQTLFIRQSLDNKSFDKEVKAYLHDVVVYSQEVELEVHDCSLSQADGSNCMIIVFSIYSYQSLARMMDKWLQTIRTKAVSIPILLVGLDFPVFRETKAMSHEKIMEVAGVMKVLRYFQVSNREEAEEVFLEAARISVRELHSTLKIETIEKLQTACEKRLPRVDLRKRSISLLPSLIYYLIPFLQKIRLDNNSFKHFPMELIAFDKLRELTISMNQIADLPPEISKMTSLEKLDLEFNLLDDLPLLSLKSMKSLEELRVKGNPLSNVPEEVAKGRDGNWVPFITSFIIKSEIKKHHVFGIALEDLIKEEEALNEYPNSFLPRIIQSGLNHIIRYGISLEGIFRVAGQNNRCNQLKELIDYENALFPDSEDPHNVASIIKQWLRDLPSPVFLYQNFDLMLSLNQLKEEEKVERLKRIISSLPNLNYHLVRQLFRVMYIISLNSHVNRMDEANITKVIGPNLLFSNELSNSNDPFVSLNLISNVNDILTTVTHHYPLLFEDNLNLFDMELLDPRPTAPAIMYRKMCGHEKSVVGICLSSDGSSFWSADSKGIIRIWHSFSFKLIDVIETNVKRINSIIKCKENYWITTTGAAQIYSEKERKLIEEIPLQPYSATVVGDNVIFDSQNSLSLFSGLTLKKIVSVEISYTVTSIVFVSKGDNNNNNKIWVSCGDQKIRVLHPDTLEVEEELDYQLPRYFKLLYLNNNVWCFAENKSILVVNSLSKEVVAKFEGIQKGKVFSVFIVNNNKVWVADRSGVINVYNQQYLSEGNIQTYHCDAIGGVICYPDPSLNALKIISASWDKSLICWLSDL